MCRKLSTEALRGCLSVAYEFDFPYTATMLEEVRACRVCGSDSLTGFFDLGEQPFANALLKDPNHPDPRYPLALVFCNECSLVQLSHRAREEELFSEYVWVTGTSKKIHEFADIFCDRLVRRAGEPKDSYVLEIASNDGTLLKPFQKRGYSVLGIDPAENIAQMARESGVPTEALFWGKDTAQHIVQKRGLSKMLFARNVLPHVSDQRDFVEGLSTTLHPDGVLAVEVHYAGIILRELHYDSIYHEHHCYFSLKNLERLLNDFGMYAFDIEESPVSGGSIIVYAKKQQMQPSASLLALRASEEKNGVNTRSSWNKFAERASAHKTALLSLFQKLRSKGSVLGYGASARASTLLNFCGITRETLPSIADKNPLKQGLYTAGTHIPIIPIDQMLSQKPSSVFVLAWNFKDEIIEELREMGFRGTFLIPFPDPPHIL